MSSKNQALGFIVFLAATLISLGIAGCSKEAPKHEEELISSTATTQQAVASTGQTLTPPKAAEFEKKEATVQNYLEAVLQFFHNSNDATKSAAKACYDDVSETFFVKFVADRKEKGANDDEHYVWYKGWNTIEGLKFKELGNGSIAVDSWTGANQVSADLNNFPCMSASELKKIWDDQ